MFRQTKNPYPLRAISAVRSRNRVTRSLHVLAESGVRGPSTTIACRYHLPVSPSRECVVGSDFSDRPPRSAPRAHGTPWAMSPTVAPRRSSGIPRTSDVQLKCERCRPSVWLPGNDRRTAMVREGSEADVGPGRLREELHRQFGARSARRASGRCAGRGSARCSPSRTSLRRSLGSSGLVPPGRRHGARSR